MDCRVLFDYKAVEEDELDLKKGEFLSEVISGGDLEDGWWSGVLNGKRGVFPNNFVEPISSQPSIPTPAPVPPPAHSNTSPPNNSVGMYTTEFLYNRDRILFTHSLHENVLQIFGFYGL